MLRCSDSGHALHRFGRGFHLGGAMILSRIVVTAPN